VCYAEDKEEFIKEAYRVLKKGGRLIIWDGFLARKPINKKEKEELDIFLEGWALPNLDGVSEFKNSLVSVGFKNIKEYDVSKESLPSADKIYKMSRWSYPFSILLNKFKLIPLLLVKNNRSGIMQHRIITNGIMEFRVYYAEK